MHGGHDNRHTPRPALRKAFRRSMPGQFAEREADMATSNALYQKAWDTYLSRTGRTEDEVRADLSKAARR